MGVSVGLGAAVSFFMFMGYVGRETADLDAVIEAMPKNRRVTGLFWYPKIDATFQWSLLHSPAYYVARNGLSGYPEVKEVGKVRTETYATGKDGKTTLPVRVVRLEGGGHSWPGSSTKARLIAETDLRYPIILGADGRVMDGMHRVAKAYLEGREVIDAVQLEVDPAPDFVGVDEGALPYDEGAP
jgi:poly(3-hydroxybutyrate) depolymerase